MSEDCRPCMGQGIQYGVAPHVHNADMVRDGKIFGSTVIKHERGYPENFEPDPDAPGLGTWTCLSCGGSGKVEKEKS